MALGFACVDRAPWSLALLPLLLLAAFLAARAAEEWPRTGFPILVLSVGLFVVAAGLFRAGVGWAREWDALRHAGTLPVEPGFAPLLGTILAVALGGSALGILFLHGDTVWRTLSSVRLAVVTLCAVGILSVIGTMVVQRFGAGAAMDDEKEFVEKFRKGQGAIPVNARYMLSRKSWDLSAAEREKVDLVARAFGTGKARTLEMNLKGFHEKSEKAMEIDRHVEGRQEELLRLFTRLETLGFTNVFRTWWFNSLLVLLFVQVVAVIHKRYPWGWWQAGWVVTHVGVLVVLAGCVISDGLLRDGNLALSPGQTADAFEETTRLNARGKPVPSELGFRVKMLGTDQTFYHELQVVFPGVRAGDDLLWTQEQLRVGRTIPMTDPGTGTAYEVRIADAWERALVETAMVSAKAAGRTGGRPALRLQFLHLGEEDAGKAHVVDEGWLFSDGTSTGTFPPQVVQYRVAATAEEERSFLTGEYLRGTGKHGTLRVRLPGVEGALAVPATPGQSGTATAADGTAWTVTVERYYAAFRIRGPEPEGAQEEDFPEQPALRVEVRKGEASAPMIVYANPELQGAWESIVRTAAGGGGHGGTQRFGHGPAGEASFEFAFLPARKRVVVDGPSGRRTLAVHAPGRDPETHDVSKAGASIPLGFEGLVLSVAEALPDAVPDVRIQPLHEEGDDEYLASCLRTLETGTAPPPTVAVARLVVTERDGKGTRTRDEWLVAEGRAGTPERRFVSSDGRLVILLAETKAALMFRSALEVQTLDGAPVLVDGKPYRHVVRVNHPLQWGGFAFYQNNFIAETAQSAAASVFRVKYDRGIPTIYTGFVLLVLGVCTMLYVNPALRRRQRAAAPTNPEA